MVVVVLSKCIWWVILVANSLSTYVLIFDSMNWESGWDTSGTTLSPTHSLWWWDCFEALWAVVTRIGHVEISNPHPHSCAATALPGHITVNLTCIAHSGPLNPVVTGSAALFYELTRWCRVLKGAIWKELDCVLWEVICHLVEDSILLLYTLQKLLLQGCNFCTR